MVDGIKIVLDVDFHVPGKAPESALHLLHCGVIAHAGAAGKGRGSHGPF